MLDTVDRIIRLAGRNALRAGLALCLLTLVAIGLGPWTGRYRVVTVLTGSMRPTMPVGSVVISTPEPFRAVRVGQVISFHTPEGDHPVVTHRVVEVVSGGAHPLVRTKGDANSAPDPWLARLEDEPAWRVRAVVPTVGNVVRFFRLPVVHRATVFAAPALLALMVIVGIWLPSPPGAPSDPSQSPEAGRDSAADRADRAPTTAPFPVPRASAALALVPVPRPSAALARIPSAVERCVVVGLAPCLLPDAPRLVSELGSARQAQLGGPSPVASWPAWAPPPRALGTGTSASAGTEASLAGLGSVLPALSHDSADADSPARVRQPALAVAGPSRG